MALDVNELADIINNALSVTDKDNNKISTTDQMKTYARAIITTLQAGQVDNLSGTVKGQTSAGSPLQQGKAENGTISSLQKSLWVGIMMSGFGGADSSFVDKEASQSTLYISGEGSVSFSEGSITGNCTSTSEAPGSLVNGQGKDGVISGLVGTDWASRVIPPLADAAMSERLYTAIANYIMENAEVSYGINSVTGIAPATSGPLELGTANSGKIA